MTTIRTVTQEELSKKFSEFSKAVLGTSLQQSDVAIVSERKPSKISVIESKDLLSTLKERGFTIPTSMEDVAVISVLGSNAQKKVGKKMKR